MTGEFLCRLCGHHEHLESLHLDGKGYGCPECDHPFGTESVDGLAARLVIAVGLLLRSVRPEWQAALAERLAVILERRAGLLRLDDADHPPPCGRRLVLLSALQMRPRLAKLKQVLADDPAFALSVLQEAGIVDSEGQSTERFRG